MLENVQEFIFNLIITGISSAFAKTIVAPLERTKLILQNQESSLQVLKKQRKTYTGIIDVMIRVPQEQGFLSFWRGNATNVIRYVPTSSLNFAFNDLYKRLLFDTIMKSRTKDWKWTISINFLSGGLAGCSTTFFVFPLDFCTTKLSVDIGTARTFPDRRFNLTSNVRREYSGLTNCLRVVYKRDGLRGYYYGIKPAIIGLGIYRSIYFGLFEFNKMFWLGINENTTYEHFIPIHLSFLFAQAAALTASTLCYPFDTVMRMMMLDAGRSDKYRKNFNVMETFVHIYKTKGSHGFYKGLVANCLRCTGGSLVLVLYDKILYYTEWKKFINTKIK